MEGPSPTRACYRATPHTGRGIAGWPGASHGWCLSAMKFLPALVQGFSISRARRAALYIRATALTYQTRHSSSCWENQGRCRRHDGLAQEFGSSKLRSRCYNAGASIEETRRGETCRFAVPRGVWPISRRIVLVPEPASADGMVVVEIDLQLHNERPQNWTFSVRLRGGG